MDFVQQQKVLQFCVKHGLEVRDLKDIDKLPYIVIICPEEGTNKDSYRQELMSFLPVGSRIIFKVDVKKNTMDVISRELEATQLPWSIQVDNHVINVKTVIPKDHPVWDRIMMVTSKDGYVKNVSVKVLDPDTIREQIGNGKTLIEAQSFAEENAETFTRSNVKSNLNSEISDNKDKGRPINKDDLLDLSILLNTCNTVEDLLKSL